MAPSRGKGRIQAPATPRTPAPSQRTPRSTRKAKDAESDVYGDMLAEAAVTDPALNPDRPLKRRRIMREVSIPSHEAPQKPAGRRRNAPLPEPVKPETADEASDTGSSATKNGRFAQQTAEASSDDSDESEFGFEDVDLEQKTGTDGEEDGIADVSISVGSSPTTKSAARAKRKPATIAEKTFRLLVHKAHLLCLLGHCVYINSWCNNTTVQRNLRSLLDKRMISYLNPKAEETQFQRNRSFIDGLEMAKDAFNAHFRITASGMHRPHWLIDGEGHGGLETKADTEPMDRSDFIHASKNFEGSQDTGNQLFCALLRAAGVDARLVCSLQVLPFANAPKAATPVKVKKPTVFAIASDTDPNASDVSADDKSVGSSAGIGKIPSVRRRLGQPSFNASPTTPSRPMPQPKKKSVRKLSYPVFWTEAFNPAYQKWVPVDPVVTNTVNKASKFEPPASYDANQMSYVIAFEDDGVARDVTRRYAKAFNAKTRRQRVESSTDGAAWLKKAMRLFRRRGPALDRDQVEDAELAQKEAREGLPGNVLDFKDHPYYALERHLKRHEVLHPKREVGKVNAGTAAKPRMEAVYRRQDVVACRSSDKWYRLGREIKAGEQPLKHVPARAGRRARSPRDDEEDGDDITQEQTALYAPFQTQLYVPPPVVRGKIPRNAFGNLDIYVPSMVPAGGVHVRHTLARQAARILKIDHADAVTGFKFQGRHGTAVVEGVIVAQEYGDAVDETIEGLEQEVAHDESRLRSLEALRLWKRFLIGLRIAERVSHYGDTSTTEKVRREMDAVEEKVDGMAEAGGFVLNEAEETAMPTAGQFSLAQLSARSKAAKGGKRKMIVSEDEEEGVDDGMPDAEPSSRPSRRAGLRSRRVLQNEEDEDEEEFNAATGQTLGHDSDYANGEDDGGGFIPEDAMEFDGDGAGGGFIPDDPMQTDDERGGLVPEDATSTANKDGGFMPEDAAEDHEEAGFEPENPYGDGDSSLSDHEPSAEPAHASKSRVGSITEEHLDGALASEAVVRSGRVHEVHTPSTAHFARPEPQDSGIEQNLRSESADKDTDSDHKQLQSGTNQQHDVKAAKDDDSDRGSLLSHDPDDEDAEPDWLDSD